MLLHNLHTHNYTEATNVLELVNQYPWDFDETIPVYSVGIHPWYINEDRLESDFQMLEKIVQIKGCFAIGECGLDKRIAIPMELQIAVFEKQIALAEYYKKPLVLHLVAAFDELVEIKKRLKVSVPMVIHGFSKNLTMANKLVSNGFYLSFGKHLVSNPDLKNVISSIPIDRLFLETDTSDCTLDAIYDMAANFRKMPLNDLKHQIMANWNRVFNQ